MFFFFQLDDLHKVFAGDAFDLPIKHNKKDFSDTLETLFDNYKKRVKANSRNDIRLYNNVCKTCELVMKTINNYLLGHVKTSLLYFDKLFKHLDEHSLTIIDNETSLNENIFLDKLFRARRVEENRNYSTTEIFHIPFNFRYNIESSRYSIAGFPCLYLSSSLKLCLEELDYKINSGRYIASRFNINVNNCELRIFDLGIKPKDFEFVEYEGKTQRRKDLINRDDITKESYFKNYMIWYPFIASCSFTRVNKKDKFFPEYILPQLLMEKLNRYTERKKLLVGVRYFSCSSNLASEMGFNYAFPASIYKKINANFLSDKLSNIFSLTTPILLNEYEDLESCQNKLLEMNLKDLPNH